MAKAGPIVITLKKRLGPSRATDEDDIRGGGGGSGGGGSAPAPPPPPPPPPPPTGAARSRSRSRSPRVAMDRLASPARASPPREFTPAIASSAVLNVGALEDIFSRFHGELDSWLQTESVKLERAEARGSTASGELAGAAERVCGFLRDLAPRVYEDLGRDAASADNFAARTLPRFLEMLDDDRRVLQEMTDLLSAFADRRLSKSESLADLKAGSTPVPLLRALLRHLAASPGGGGDRSANRGADRGRDRGDDRVDGVRRRRRRRVGGRAERGNRGGAGAESVSSGAGR
eukprot:TRINITY_DN18081_c0_g1_i1.p1 TRINITY_DN18081_c0_g1~~TRINITY_DN18081_c0_g1_i1.p1  ORF type:complete len:308 (+),score=67.11 TRINITY_DN18081_c0_g1_i1:58-924(+)